jgi:hypothetical protein
MVKLNQKYNKHKLKTNKKPVFWVLRILSFSNGLAQFKWFGSVINDSIHS